jgi:RHS repeat-associated protein
MAGDYRFGFNGMENENEFTGKTGSHLDFGARIYDSRLGRWLSVDPSMQSYPYLSPFVFVNNNPNIYIDPDGRKFILSFRLKETTEFYNRKVNELKNSSNLFNVIYSNLDKVKDEIKVYDIYDVNGSYRGGYASINWSNGQTHSINHTYIKYNLYKGFGKSTFLEETFHAQQDRFYHGSVSNLELEVEAKVMKMFSFYESISTEQRKDLPSIIFASKDWVFSSYELNLFQKQDCYELDPAITNYFNALLIDPSAIDENTKTEFQEAVKNFAKDVYFEYTKIYSEYMTHEELENFSGDLNMFESTIDVIMKKKE